jgi:alkylation response protein AidB-like acyl-CoA dehydrogenase
MIEVGTGSDPAGAWSMTISAEATTKAEAASAADSEALAELARAVRGAAAALPGGDLATKPVEPSAWSPLPPQMQLAGIAVPERFGGQGFGYRELSAVLVELGAVLYSGPFLSTVGLAANVILAHATEQQCAQLLPEIAAGRRQVSVALSEPGRAWDDVTVQVSETGRLTGEKTFVLNGMDADLLLVCARSGRDGQLRWHVVDCQEPSVLRVPLSVHDVTRGQALARFDGCPVTTLGPGAPAELVEFRRIANFMLSSELVGLSSAAFELGLAHVRDRVQFGRPLAAFQAIKHRFAEMYALVRCAEAVVRHAASTMPDGWSLHESAMSKAWIADSAVSVSSQALEAYGALGFTWEHPGHLFFRRARSDAMLLGDPRAQRELIAAAALGRSGVPR